MQEFADQLSAQLSSGSEDYRASAHRNTTIANESGFEVENPGTNDTPRGGKCALWETGGQTRRNPGTENRETDPGLSPEVPRNPGTFWCIIVCRRGRCDAETASPRSHEGPHGAAGSDHPADGAAASARGGVLSRGLPAERLKTHPRRRRVLWRAPRVHRGPARVPPPHKRSLRLRGSR